MAMCGNNLAITILMLVDLIILSDVQMSFSAAINSEGNVNRDPNTKESILKLHDANGEWGIMLQESPELSDFPNEDAHDIKTQNSEFAKTFLYNEEDFRDNFEAKDIKMHSSKENYTSHKKPKNNKRDVNRLKRSTRRRGSRRHLSRRSELLRPPTPPPDLRPPPWQVNQGLFR